MEAAAESNENGDEVLDSQINAPKIGEETKEHDQQMESSLSIIESPAAQETTKEELLIPESTDNANEDAVKEAEEKVQEPQEESCINTNSQRQQQPQNKLLENEKEAEARPAAETDTPEQQSTAGEISEQEGNVEDNESVVENAVSADTDRTSAQNVVQVADQQETEEPSSTQSLTSTTVEPTEISDNPPVTTPTVVPQLMNLESEVPVQPEDERYHTPHLNHNTFDTPRELKEEQSEPQIPITASNQPDLSTSTSSSSSPSSSLSSKPFQFDPTIVIPLDMNEFAVASVPLLYPKLALTLSSSNVPIPVKLRALNVCVSLSKRCLCINDLISHGVYDELVMASVETNDEIRILATTALIHILQSRQGRQLAQTVELFQRLPILFIDHIPLVRGNAAILFKQLSLSSAKILFLTPTSPAAAAAPSFLSFLLKRVLLDPNYENKHLLIQCILPAIQLKEGKMIARSNETLSILYTVLVEIPQLDDSPLDRVKQKEIIRLLTSCCQLIAVIGVEAEGKIEVVKHQLHQAIIRLVRNTEVEVRLAATTAMMNTTIGLIGKTAFVQVGAIETCVERLQIENDSSVLCMLLQSMANLAESKEGRAGGNGLMQQSAVIQRITSLLNDESSSKSLVMSAKSALQKIQWRP